MASFPETPSFLGSGPATAPPGPGIHFPGHPPDLPFVPFGEDRPSRGVLTRHFFLRVQTSTFLWVRHPLPFSYSEAQCSPGTGLVPFPAPPPPPPFPSPSPPPRISPAGVYGRKGSLTAAPWVILKLLYYCTLQIVWRPESIY